MNRRISLGLLAAAAVVLPTTFTLAAGPVSGEVTALYWASNSSIESSGSTISDHSYDPAARAQLWFVKKVGLSADWAKPEADYNTGSNTSMQYSNLDFKWRFLSASQNNFFALGAGWQQVDVNGTGLSSDRTSGVRLVADGRVSFVKVLYGYGRAAYLPRLKDWNDGVSTFSDGKGYEAELGLQIKPSAFIQIFIAYRKADTTFTDSVSGSDVHFDHDGPMLGFGVNF